MQTDIQQLATELGLGLDLFSCIQCGKCTGGCPVSITTALNVRSLVYGALVGDIAGPVHREELWDCTCCFTCVERCPKDVRPAEVIIALRSMLVEEGKIPSTIGTALMGIFRQGNPLGYARDDRMAWAEGLEVQPAQEGCETLLFTCCSSAYDMRAQSAAKALVRVLRRRE
jgi:heterodisulfide reductase subunit C